MDAGGKMIPVFVGGCGRSGTTLLGSILGSHPSCLVTPESKFVYQAYRAARLSGPGADLDAAFRSISEHPNFKMWDVEVPETFVPSASPSYADLIDELVHAYGRSVGHDEWRFWIDHTPMNTAHAPTLHGLFPESRLIHIVRDGRAVASSILQLDWGPNTVPRAAAWWRDHVALGFAAERFYGPERSMQVRYEDLVRDPERTTVTVCEFLGIDFVPEMLEGRGLKLPAYTTSQHALVGSRPMESRTTAWEQSLSAREVEIFEDIAGDMLLGLGYQVRFGASARRMTRRERLFLRAKEGATSMVNRGRHRRRTERFTRRPQR